MSYNILVLDLETTVKRVEGRIDNSPFNPFNKCVSAHYCFLKEDFLLNLPVVTNDIFFHTLLEQSDYAVADHTKLKQSLKEADLLVCHNAKFDIMWLLEMGFELPDNVYCTLIGEYVLCKGQRQPLSLKESALRRRLVNQKKGDLVDQLFREGTDFSEMPIDTMLEYAEADVLTTGELYLSQQQDFLKEENASLSPVVDLMNDMLMFLVEIERNGTAISLDTLEDVEREFELEKSELTERLKQIVEIVMGDSPINLNSGADMTKVVYSREVTSREAHQQTFNIGTNSAGKALRPPRMTPKEFSDAVRSTTKVVQKTMASRCVDCNGIGSIQQYKMITRTKNKKKFRVQGEPYKNRTKCKTCKGLGAVYNPTGETAGLKMTPKNPNYASINGFKTDKETIKVLIQQAQGKGYDIAVEFLTKMSRLNAVSTYLDSFVAGIQRGTRPNGLLHANFNQCVTATGRLSSSDPNLQNQPKRGFPVRKAIVSRFGNSHLIVEADYSGLEFRTCVELSKDAQGMSDILEGKDIHAQSAGIILQKPASEVTKEERQLQGKPNTFLPLFGGTGYGSPDHVKAYFGRFYEIYEGIHGWHQALMSGTLKNGTVKTPSGRQYFWPNVTRTKNGRVTHVTQILNYPVQGFSADLVQLACIRALRLFKASNLQSKLILTVHDSIVVDCFAPELEQVKAILTEAMTKVGDESKERFGYALEVPLNIEISAGNNWLEQSDLVLTNAT